MKKLFFIFSIVTATVFTNQIVKPMESSEKQEPPKKLFIKPYFQCNLDVNAFVPNHMAQLIYSIHTPDQKLPPLQEAPGFDLPFITLTFVPDETDTIATSFLIDSKVRLNGSYLSNFSSVYGTQVRVINCPFQANMFNNPEFIELIIKIALSKYFRSNVLQFKGCLHCSEEIKDLEPAILLKCGNGVHESCYNEGDTKKKLCPSCNKTLENDNWCHLFPILRTIGLLTL